MPTFFEVSTAAAFLAFADADVDVAVVEVGLGGRHDATNVIVPAVSAITNIEFDHERHLGRTIAAIAAEKAGIAKAGVPLVMGAVSPEARAVIAAAAAGAGAPLVPVQDGTDRDHVDRGRPRRRAVHDPGAGVSAGAARPRRHPPDGERRRGRARARDARGTAPARCRRRRGDRRPARRAVAGAARVAAPRRRPARACSWTRPTTRPGPGRWRQYLDDAVGLPITLVTSVMRDKDMAGVLAPAAAAGAAGDRHAGRHAARQRTAERSPRRARGSGRRDSTSTVEPDPWAAVSAALGHPEPVAIAGSIFLIGPLRAALLERGGFEPA